MLHSSMLACELSSAKSKRSSTWKPFVLTLFCSGALMVVALPIHAQTGPLPKKSSGGPGAPPPHVVQGLTAERVVQLLQGKGARTEVKLFDNNGVKITRVSVTMEQNDFMYVFDINLVTPPSGTKFWFFSSVLNTNAKNLPLDKLQGLLTKNFGLAGNCAFMVNPQGALQLNSCSYGGAIDDQLFHSDIAFFLRSIRESANVWYSSAS
ncbi:MAG TPA: hypothetical protein VFE62_11055 [Gemmataceae bacterium]|nr:hypothetical protein [Gemmataceae bacterium]